MSRNSDESTTPTPLPELPPHPGLPVGRPVMWMPFEVCWSRDGETFGVFDGLGECQLWATREQWEAIQAAVAFFDPRRSRL